MDRIACFVEFHFFVAVAGWQWFVLGKVRGVTMDYLTGRWPTIRRATKRAALGIVMGTAIDVTTQQMHTFSMAQLTFLPDGMLDVVILFCLSRMIFAVVRLSLPTSVCRHQLSWGFLHFCSLPLALCCQTKKNMGTYNVLWVFLHWSWVGGRL